MPAGRWIAGLGAVALPAGAWYLASWRLMRVAGGGEAAMAVGLFVAGAVAFTLWRWSQRDADRDALSRGACPRCASGLRRSHEHARPSGLSGGLVEWSCPSCGFERSEVLTCAQCAP